MAKFTHTIKASDLEALFRRAAQQGKEARYIVTYDGEYPITLEGVVHR